MSRVVESAGITDIAASEPTGVALGEIVAFLKLRLKRIVAVSVAAGVLSFVVTSLLPPIFTARTIVLPPQQQQSSAAAALNSLGALGGLAGLGGVAKSPADQYVSFMQSTPVLDRIIDEFDLMRAYDEKYRVDAQRDLLANTVIYVGKKDGLITVEVDDRDPHRAAGIANAFVTGLRHMTNTLAVSEAQQRRVFFEQQLQATKDRLTQAQVALQGSGFNANAIQAEPKAAAESYAKLRADATAAEVKLQSMRKLLADNAPEFQQQQAVVQALRAEVAAVESRVQHGNGPVGGDYVGKYREYKYQETLFDLLARQYEIARVDESREGALIQVVEPATPPERKSKPKRALIAIGCAVLAGLVMSLLALMAYLRPVRAA